MQRCRESTRARSLPKLNDAVKLILGSKTSKGPSAEEMGVLETGAASPCSWWPVQALSAARSSFAAVVSGLMEEKWRRERARARGRGSSRESRSRGGCWLQIDVADASLM